MTARERRAAGKAGRPPLHGKRMEIYNVRLDVATVAVLKALGGGNLSLGIRRLAGTSVTEIGTGQSSRVA